MVQARDAAVAVAGQIIDIEKLKHFDTKLYDGLKVTVATGDGIAVAKLSPDDAELAQPVAFSNVAWLVRYGAYSNRERGTDAQVTCRFVDILSAGELDRIGSFSGLYAPAGK